MSHNPSKQQAAVARLVGRKCSVNCCLNDIKVTTLWDTGAQISTITEHILKQQLPDLTIRDINELVGVDSNIKLIGSEENEDRDVMGQSKASTTGGKEDDANQEESVTPKVDLSGLTPEQQHVVRKICEERDAFAENDIGCIPDLKMNINLTDTRPVQNIYTAILCPLHPEVKH